MVRTASLLLVILVLISGCGNDAGSSGANGGSQTGGGSGGGPPPGPPQGPPPAYGTATLTFYGNSPWPFDRVGTAQGTILAVDDMGDRHVQLLPPEGPTFVIFASNWPQTEGPADLSVPCNGDTVADSRFDACTFHFTEMKVGVQGTYWSTWYLHGSLSATKGGTPVLTATF